MNKEELIGKLQMVYVGDRNALNELIGYYDGLKEFVELLKKENKKYKEVIDKANKKLNNFIECCKAEKLESGSDYLHHQYWDMFERFNKQIKDILKEVK